MATRALTEFCQAVRLPSTQRFADSNAILSCIQLTKKVILYKRYSFTRSILFSILKFSHQASLTSRVKIGNKQDKSPKPDVESESSWVLDSLIGFLQGPIWNIPIISFIEQKSIIFEPDKTDIEEDDQVQSSTEAEDEKNDVDSKQELEEEYRKIFVEYGSLVDRLLASHMEDLQISLEQFENACENAKGNLGPQFHRTLFEQIWAANDFEIFRVMMIKRNLELHIQAMTVLTQSLTQDHPSLNNVDGDESLRYLFDDDALMDEVMKISLAPRDGDSGLEDNSKQDMVKAALEERDRLEAEKRKEEKKLEQALSRAMGGSSESENVEHSPRTKKKLNTMEKIDEKKNEKDNQEEKKDGKVSKNKVNDDQKLISSKKKLVDPEEVKNRQEYLRKRRDMILETKQKERVKQVKQLEENELKEKRPKSAKAIRSVIVDELESLPPEDEGLKFRRSLAARLKAEVIEKK
ncbi:uncharacterized protein LOC141857420 [Brevipalpus obovatus]|uniref:uncharacterized protein LOC141857420 n=1 Tax=Brevipalpus obovatus TaxID=246614 RepID=UPI003D9E112E